MRTLDSDLFLGDPFPDEHYRKIRQLGRGGDGVVYLVCHLPTEQLRAAKCLKDKHPGKRVQELELMKKLRHPALPKILDILEAEEQVWLIMEYISGRCIADISKEEVSPSQFFSIARQLSEALIYLHTRPAPILHLDIKPSNVLLKKDGSLVLIDFGAAIFLTDGCGGHYGTLGFAAPEQGNADARIDGRADVYGFGALLYYYLFHDTPKSWRRKQKGRDKQKQRGQDKQRQKEQDKLLKRLHVCSLLRQYLCEDAKDRFEDCKVLYQAVCMAEKRYYRGKRIRRTYAALGLLAIVSAFALSRLADRQDDTKQLSLQSEKAYMRLMEQAETLGFSQAAECYKEAAGLCPEKSEWCISLIERIGEDYLFEEQEEEALKELIYMVLPGSTQTFLEEQKKDPLIYGELTYRLGILYWYFYDNTGGKRAATGWFEQALSMQSQYDTDPQWLESARIHADIGKYCETLGRKDENGAYLADYSTYWKDLKKLWRLESIKKRDTGICAQIADEMLSCLILHAYEIYESGEVFEETEQILEQLEQFICLESMSDEGKRRAQQCQAARSAVKRVYQMRTKTRRGES